MESGERDYLRGHRAHDVGHLHERWMRLAEETGMAVEVLVEKDGWPVLAFRSPTVDRGGPISYLSAGIHGDEPAGPWGLLQWAEAHPAELRERALFLAPCLNPWGLQHNMRTDSNARDMNRWFDREDAKVVGRLKALLGRWEIGLGAMLHEDFDAQGSYLYELCGDRESVAEEVMAAVDRIIPRQEEEVDGRPVERGIVSKAGDLSEVVAEIDGMPEAIYVALQHGARSLTFETPSEWSLHRRVRAQAAFVEAMLRTC